jgi:plasmid stabilization system protein ParE
MAYLVNVSIRAQRDLAVLYEAIDAGNSAAARRWYAGLKQVILDLENQPHIWPRTHEARGLRHILYGHKPHNIYRVIYKVMERKKKVDVLHIRHGARRGLTASDLK